MLLRARHNDERFERWRSQAALKLAVAAFVALMALGILSGCGSFFSSSSSPSHLAYVTGGLTDVTAYRIDNKSGAPSSIVTAPYVAGNSPSSIVVHPSNKFLYVANAADSTISLFSINSGSGTLTEVLPRTTSGFSPGFFSVIAVLSVSSSSLQFVGSYLVTNGVGGIAVDPGAKFLYATNPATNTVSGFAIQAGGGLVAMPGLTVATGTTPVAAAVNLAGSALYVANSGAANVSQFTVDSTTGVLTAFVAGSVVAGTNPAFLVVDPGGKFIFVGNTGSNSVTELAVASDGSVTSGNTINVAFVPRSFAATQ